MNMRKSLLEKRQAWITILSGTRKYQDSAPLGRSGNYKSYTGKDDQVWFLGVLAIIVVLGIVMFLRDFLGAI